MTIAMPFASRKALFVAVSVLGFCALLFITTSYMAARRVFTELALSPFVLREAGFSRRDSEFVYTTRIAALKEDHWLRTAIIEGKLPPGHLVEGVSLEKWSTEGGGCRLRQ